MSNKTITYNDFWGIYPLLFGQRNRVQPNLIIKEGLLTTNKFPQLTAGRLIRLGKAFIEEEKIWHELVKKLQEKHMVENPETKKKELPQEGSEEWTKYIEGLNETARLELVIDNCKIAFSHLREFPLSAMELMTLEKLFDNDLETENEKEEEVKK